MRQNARPAQTRDTWSFTLVLILAAMIAGVSMARAGAACRGADDMLKNSLTLYPTGGHVSRFDGESGDQVAQNLLVGGEVDEVVFLYSGNGPTTGARGRYMYLLLDADDCILKSDWIDGETYDRVVPAK